MTERLPAWTPELATTLATITDHVAKEGFMPTLPQLAEKLNRTPGAIHARIKHLVALGLVSYERRNLRTMKLTGKPVESLFSTAA